EVFESKIAAELAVDSHEQVAVEGGGDAERIVVGEQQIALRLDEVSADEQRIAAHERRADGPQEGIGAGRIEVADVRPEKQRERPSGSSASRRCDLDEA